VKVVYIDYKIKKIKRCEMREWMKGEGEGDIEMLELNYY